MPTPANVSGSNPAKIANGDKARLVIKGVHAFSARIKNQICTKWRNQIKTEVKQYSSDVAIAVLLCLVLIQINGNKLSFTQILNFGIVGAIAIWFSYPAIFVLAGIGISYLLISLFEKNLLKTIKLLGIYTIWALSFVCFYFVSLKNLASQEDLYKSWASRGTFPTSFLRY